MPHKNPNANRAYQRQWARDRRERLVAIGGKRDAFLRSRYGLTEAKWEALFQAQGRKCAICATDNPKSKVGWHTDHDHKTGTVRGILCENCNRGLGMYQDDIGFLRKAAAYLGEHQGVFTGEDIRRAAAIQPIEARTVVNGMTHGLGPAGYDIRLDQDLVLKPKGFSLGSAMEYFDIPNDCVAMVFELQQAFCI